MLMTNLPMAKLQGIQRSFVAGSRFGKRQSASACWSQVNRSRACLKWVTDQAMTTAQRRWRRSAGCRTWLVKYSPTVYLLLRSPAV